MKEYNVIFSPSRGFWTAEGSWCHGIADALRLNPSDVMQLNFCHTRDAQLIAAGGCQHLSRADFIKLLIQLLLPRFLRGQPIPLANELLGAHCRVLSDGQLILEAEGSPQTIEQANAHLIARLARPEITREQLLHWGRRQLHYTVHLDRHDGFYLLSPDASREAEAAPKIPRYSATPILDRQRKPRGAGNRRAAQARRRA